MGIGVGSGNGIGIGVGMGNGVGSGNGIGMGNGVGSGNGIGMGVGSGTGTGAGTGFGIGTGMGTLPSFNGNTFSLNCPIILPGGDVFIEITTSCVVVLYEYPKPCKRLAFQTRHVK